MFHGWRTTFEGALLNICHAHRDIPLHAMLLLGIAGCLIAEGRRSVDSLSRKA